MRSMLDVTSKRGESGSPTLTPREPNTAPGSTAKGQGEVRRGPGTKEGPGILLDMLWVPTEEAARASEDLAHGLAYDAGCVRWSFAWKE